MSSDSSDPQQTRRRLIYSGRVQGVGFRYTTGSIAKRYPVIGYVKNLPDGTVEMVVEGSAGIVDDFLAEVTGVFRTDIEYCSCEYIKSDESFKKFEVRY